MADAQPRPVRLAARVLGAASMILGVVPTVGSEFFGFDWTTGQINAYTLAVGTSIAAGSVLFGVRVEREVTPVASPRLDSNTPLVPAAEADPIV